MPMLKTLCETARAVLHHFHMHSAPPIDLYANYWPLKSILPGFFFPEFTVMVTIQIF